VGFIPPERFPSAEPCTVRLSYPHVVSDIACSCSEDQEATMPRNFRALLPAKIRTRLEPMRARADTLMGFCTLRKQLTCRECQWPGARPDTPCGVRSPRRLRAPAPEAETTGGISDSMGPTSNRRAFTKTCPRVLPATAVMVKLLRLQVSRLRSCRPPGLRGREEGEPEGTLRTGS
jgi:hypothetical protein